MTMDLDRLQEALKDFDKRVKKEVCPVLDEFLCHVAKTGETMFQWSQIKTYFIFKLEKVMEDFKTSAPEARGPSNPNVEYIPYEEMKERILKIVSGFNGIPFTIQRLCELLTEPRRNYSGTDKFLRGVEKNVMVVSCVHPTSEKTNSHSLNRMNGVMFPGNSPSYTDRSNINGPGTPRPLNRPKLSLSNPMTTNGLPDSTENKDLNLLHTEDKLHSDVTTIDSPQGSTIKNKHSEEDYVEAEGHEVKRLKFDQEEEDDDDDDHDAASPPLPGEAASEMAEEAGPCSRSPEKDTEISCAGLQSTTSEEDEESYMTATEVTSESSDAEKDANDIVSVSEETCDENEMEESDQCEAKDVHSGVDHSSCAVSTASECSGTEELVTFASEAAEVPSESMDNGEDASEVAEEPMEQD
ncbi:serine/threonine-protein phosphatase 4 regulatory subunit 2 [Ambystoma mexicanum]|uniref:serine/threonine-protein phosphatase 4 regulatory subunit 2 n=1 Tax=Ambystoma mexicanum TaxID=8296 RepID=UPI0037E8C5FF